MIPNDNILPDPKNPSVSIIRVPADLPAAKRTCDSMRENGFKSALPLPAMWDNKDGIKIFGYEIKVYENHTKLTEELRLQSV